MIFNQFFIVNKYYKNIYFIPESIDPVNMNFHSQETLQLFVNKLFDTIFGLYEGGRKIPPSVKYLFDFLDRQAIELEIGDDEVRHTWKNNRCVIYLFIYFIYLFIYYLFIYLYIHFIFFRLLDKVNSLKDDLFVRSSK